MDSSTSADGLAVPFRRGLETYFGHHPRGVFDASGVRHVTDEATGTELVRIDEVFRPGAVFIGFGAPNVFTVVPTDEGGWDKLAGFMGFSKRSYVAPTKGRVQSGVFVELVGLPSDAIAAITYEMQLHVGKRSATCARLNAEMLTAAGFTSGARPLSSWARPSRLFRRIWRNGLEWRREPVQLRFVRTGPSLVEHFTKVWRKEMTAGCRMVRKRLAERRSHAAAPVIPPLLAGVTSETPRTGGPLIEIGVSRPTWLGARLANFVGERPVFVARTQVPLDDHVFMDALKAYPGRLDFITKVKRYILFSRPVIWVLRHIIMRHVDISETVDAAGVIDMLQEGTEDDPFVYNLVVVRDGPVVELRLTRLKNGGALDHPRINWILAKHVLTAGYHPSVVYASEIWVSRNAQGEKVISLNRESGTYKPGSDRLTAFADYLSRLFLADVQIQEGD